LQGGEERQGEGYVGGRRVLRKLDSGDLRRGGALAGRQGNEMEE